MNQPIVYDIFKHNTGVRIIELNTGRKGVVEAIRETSPDYIEPLIRWDSENEISFSKGVLILEEDL